MSSGRGDRSSLFVWAFHSALAHQGVVVLGIVALVLVAANVIRAANLRAALRSGPQPVPDPPVTDSGTAEPHMRRFLRIAFGCLWLLDGILQAQPAMPGGMVSGVIQPAEAGTPSWVHHLVDFGTTIWGRHPVPAAAATVWIQGGLGLWLLLANQGVWSRLGGAASAVWGLLVWVFGEAFGGLLSPGSSWLFGLPGAVVFYVIAGVLIACPDRAFAGARLGRDLLRTMGGFFLGMAVLQAWPGRGSWDGTDVTGMVHSMVGTPQLGMFASMLRGFSQFTASNGALVNAVVVVVLAGSGLALLTGRPVVIRPGLIAAGALCLATWVLVQDFGFFGGLGTDPNSMIPMLCILIAGYLGLVRPGPPLVAARSPALAPPTARRIARPTPRLLGIPFRVLAGCGAAAIVLVGAVPMAFASAKGTPDPIVAESVDGAPNAVDFPAPDFSLVDQSGRAVSLVSLRDKVVALTFLDPVCTSDCPLIAQEMKQTDEALGSRAADVVFVAVATNPLYRSLAALQAFDRAEGLASVKNWLYLTGPLSALRHTWTEYGIQVAVEPAGSMVAHSDFLYVISQSGETRWVLNADPGAGTATSKSSFSGLLQSSISSLLGS